MRLVSIAATFLLALIGAQELQAQALDPVAQTGFEQRTRQIEQTQRERAAEAARLPRPSSPSSNTALVDPLAPAPGGPCFKINSVNLTGTERFKSAPVAHETLIGRCVTAADIGEALNTINTQYQEAGFITTRAYVPEQDVADGTLDITVVPGTLDGYIYGGGTPADARLLAAFPAKKGALVNLRDLEQGLENINAPRSANSTFQLTPGQEVGASRVQVDVEDTRPWHVGASLSNADAGGVADTSLGLNFGIDNAFGINDQLTIGLSTAPFEDRAQKYSDGINVGLNIPVGNWSYNLSAGGSRYFFVLPGINQSYDVTGRLRNIALDATRLLIRNQTAKAYAYGGLKLSRSNTFIDGFEIATQRRALTIGTLGLRGEKALTTGKLTWDVGTRFGLRAFNADLHPSSIVEREFRLIKARLSYERPVGSNGASYKGTLVAQHSNDILPGSEQFSIGGWSSVRGFSSDTMYGDSGVYLQNTIEWDAFKENGAHIRMHAGLDLGFVTPSDLRSWSQNHLVGASLGAEIKIRDKTTLTLKLAQALSRPTENPVNALPAFEGKETIGFVGLKVDF